MFHKLFPSKRNDKAHVCDVNLRNNTSKKNGGHKLDKSKIRLVILSESDKGRTPFFDSNAIILEEDIEKKTSSLLRSAPKAVVNRNCGSNTSNDSGTLTKDGPKYRFLKLGSDVKVLEEMMFGTAPMAYKGTSLKVHVLRSPHNLMVSQVFVPEKPKGDSLCSDSEPDSLSLVTSMMDFSSGEAFSITKYKEANNKSRPMDVPTADLSDYGTDDDMGFASFTSSGSLPSSFPSPSNNSLSSYSSLHKRWMRSQTTSFNNHHRKAVLESSLAAQGSKRRRQKLSIAILFGSHDEKDEEAVNLFQSFVFSHFTLVEGHVEKLRAVVEKSYFNSKAFLVKTMEALDEFRHDIFNLYTAPRLVEPVWLTMMSSSMYRPQLCENFMKEFNYLVTHFDKKDCKFFVSTLLSAVLTQHLTWVATVTPAGGSPTSKYLEKHSAKWVDTLAKSHPYNPLWAQLGDLFGAIGPPLKVSRTIVVGKKADLVKRFLYILSYFIRCSDVHERENPCSMRQILSDPPLEESLSPTLSEKTVMNGSSSEDRNSFQSPVCSQHASCSSGGTGVFSGSHGGEVIGLMPIQNLVENNSEQTETQLDEMCKEPKIVYCDNKTKDVFQRENNSKQPVIKCDSVFDGENVNDLQRERVGEMNNGTVENEQPEELPLKQRKPPQNLNLAISELDSFSNLEPLISDLSLDCPLTSNTAVSVSDLVKSSSETLVKQSVCDSKMALSELHTYQPGTTPLCSLTPLHGPKSPTVENVRHVGRYTAPYHKPEELTKRSQSFSEGKPKSRLSQQLENTSTPKPNAGTCNPSAAELRKLYLSGGTSSMFDEYYEPDAETSTANDLAQTAPALVRLSSMDNGNEVKSSLTRLLSIQDTKSLSVKNSAVTRCKPMTPEMSRRRHLSSTSSMDYDTYDPLTHGKEVKLPCLFSDSTQFNVQTFDRNFGRSLLASFSDKYMSDFVLLGTSDKKFKQRLLNDLQTTVQSSFLDEHIEEAVCVIADTDTWTVEVASSKIMRSSPSGCTSWNYSKLIADLIESVVGIYKLKMGAEFCLMHLEDRLQEIYFKSFMLAEYLQDPSKFSQQELTSMLGFENSDMSLLFAVAGTHTPSLLTGS